MRLSLFARGARLDGASLCALAGAGWRGVDLQLERLVGPPPYHNLAAGRAILEQLCDHGMQALVRLSTTPPSASASPSEHVAQLERGLKVLAALSATSLADGLAHVAVHVDGRKWGYEQAAAYLAGALPLAAVFNEQNPHVGASARETDVFGSRPTHLIGVSTITDRDAWGTAVSVST